MALHRTVITRRHVQELLPLMGLRPEHEAQLFSPPHPVDYAAAAFERLGVDLDVLVDRMGGRL